MSKGPRAAEPHFIRDGQVGAGLGFPRSGQRLICTLNKLEPPVSGVKEKFNNSKQTSLERAGLKGTGY